MGQRGKNARLYRQLREASQRCGEEHSKGPRVRMICPACGLGFNTDEKYKEHYRTKHLKKAAR